MYTPHTHTSHRLGPVYAFLLQFTLHGARHCVVDVAWLVSRFRFMQRRQVFFLFEFARVMTVSAASCFWHTNGPTHHAYTRGKRSHNRYSQTHGQYKRALRGHDCVIHASCQQQGRAPGTPPVSSSHHDWSPFFVCCCSQLCVGRNPIVRHALCACFLPCMYTLCLLAARVAPLYSSWICFHPPYIRVVYLLSALATQHIPSTACTPLHWLTPVPVYATKCLALYCSVRHAVGCSVYSISVLPYDVFWYKLCNDKCVTSITSASAI